MRYRKKPIVIDAIKYDLPLSEMIEALLMFGFKIVGSNGNKITIPTLERDIFVSPGDYIVKDIDGKFYPCKSDVFEASYEPAGKDV